MILSKKLLLSAIAMAVAFSSSSCLTKRTTTDQHGEVDETYIVKRPIKNVINNIEFE
ncbi:hypothetical protein [Luteolibacter sp. AS25]|uniref:hypothetical protein n=1 Tax=Luteolibacter sp. AS25 TaxID=3135776 RepID=UPI00398AD335